MEELIRWLRNIFRPFILWASDNQLLLSEAKSHWRSFTKFAVLQAVYFIACVTNIRALAHLQYGWAVLTDGLICLMTWTIIKQVGEAKDPYSKIGFVIGGMIGSLVGMWITRMWG